MPWTVADVDRFKKGLTDAQKQKWVQVANNTLKACIKSGGDEIDCEVQAIRTANGSFSGRRAMSLSERPNPLRPGDHAERVHLALIEADATEPDGFQLAFPIGAWQTGKYGEVIVTRTFAERMVDNWRSGIMGEKSVFMDTQHDFDEANAWAADMRVTDDGLEVKWDFTARGRELLADRRYRFYSAAIGYGTDITTGEEFFPVLHTVSLTNTPVMYTMPEAHLSTQDSPPAHGDGKKIYTPKEGQMEIKLSDVLEYLKGAEAGEKLVILKELGAADDHAQVATLSAQVTDLTGKLDVVTKAKDDATATTTAMQAEKRATQKVAVIGSALKEGRMLPKDKEYWEKAFDKQPDFTAEVIAKLPKVVDLGEHGEKGGGTEISVDDEAAFKIFRKINWKMSDDDARKAWNENKEAK